MLNTKGQISLNTILIGFLGIICYVALLPVMQELIASIAPSLDGMTLWIVQLFPLVVIIAFVMKVFKGDENA